MRAARPSGSDTGSRLVAAGNFRAPTKKKKKKLLLGNQRLLARWRLMGLFSPALTTKACKGPGPSTSTLPSAILVGGGGRPARHYPSPLARHPPKKSQWLAWRPATTTDETRDGHETNYRWLDGRLHAFAYVLHTVLRNVQYSTVWVAQMTIRQGRAGQDRAQGQQPDPGPWFGIIVVTTLLRAVAAAWP